MKGSGRSIRRRRALAGLLSLIMLAVNIMSGVTTVYGAEKKPVADAYYVLDGGDLYEAIADALESGDVFDFDSLGADEEQSSLGEYRRLLGADSVDIHHAAPDEMLHSAHDLRLAAIFVWA